MKTKERGITLIALVVTIIVLLILAGVSIQMLTGQTGILTQANNAKIEYRAATVDEEVMRWKIEKEMSNYTEGSILKTRDDLIEDQLKRGLLMLDEANTAKEKGQVQIGSRIIDYGKDEVQIKPDATLNVVLKVEEENVTGTTIPVAVEKITKSEDGLQTMEENVTYTWYIADGTESLGENLHTFNNLSENKSYILKCKVVTDNGEWGIGEVTVISFKVRDTYYRALQSMSWEDWEISNFPKPTPVDDFKQDIPITGPYEYYVSLTGQMAGFHGTRWVMYIHQNDGPVDDHGVEIVEPGVGPTSEHQYEIKHYCFCGIEFNV